MTRPLYKITWYGGELPVEPIIPIIRADAERMHKLLDEGTENRGKPGYIRGLDLLSQAVGINVRQLLRYASGSARAISVDQADKYLCATGRHLRDLWPWLYSPEQIAADVWATSHPDEYHAWIESEKRARSIAFNRNRRLRIKAEATA